MNCINNKFKYSKLRAVTLMVGCLFFKTRGPGLIHVIFLKPLSRVLKSDFPKYGRLIRYSRIIHEKFAELLTRFHQTILFLGPILIHESTIFGTPQVLGRPHSGWFLVFHYFSSQFSPTSLLLRPIPQWLVFR